MQQFTLLFALILATFTTTFSQAFNTVLRDNLTYNQSLNDVWGYAAPDGTEYALVGVGNGFSIVSLANPDDISEVHFIPGDQSIWRDMKTYGEFAYVVADQGNDGLLVVDLSGLPDNVTHEYINVTTPSSGSLDRAHNIFIDEATGIAYISGGNFNGGGMVLYDVATTPGQPIFLNTAPNIYSHDVFVQDGRMYASEINQGRLGIYDVSDPMDITLLSQRETPFSFTHNAWTNANGNYVFTTDERGDAPVASYDITDPTNPILLDEFRPGRSVGSGVIPHNTHVLDDYNIISYYTDGLEIVDASCPDNLIEVAYYDTWSGGDGGFNGCWGAYPFLPSGLVLATDITNGLFVIEVDYKRAAHLNGTITNSNTGAVLNNVSITIDTDEEADAFTDAGGIYRTGLVEGGTYDVTFFLPGYQLLTLPVTFENGVKLTLDTSLIQLVEVAVSGNVTTIVDNSPLADIPVLISGINGTYTATTDANGNVALDNIFIGDYQVYAGTWGFENQVADITIGPDGGEVFNLQLVPGYLDGFIVDQGWDTDFDATTTSGYWVRDVPNGTEGGTSNPGTDASGERDLGNRAYVTGNSPDGGVGFDDIDNGAVYLYSPVIDLSLFPDSNVVISYEYWFFNGGGGSAGDDAMVIGLDNGQTSVILKTYRLDDPNTVVSAWTADSIVLIDADIEITDEMTFFVVAEDNGDGHLSEAGLDNFYIYPRFVSSTSEVSLEGLKMNVYPNPSSDFFSVNYDLPATPTSGAMLNVVDIFGRTVEQQILPANRRVGSLRLGQNLPAGSYFLQLIVDGQQGYATKIVKQ